MITGNEYFNDGHRQSEKNRLLALRKVLLNAPLSDVPLKARINYGRWIVDCPCGSAELYFDDKFICLSCKNKWIDGKLCKVERPDNYLEIESVLEPRPLENQNWEVNETLDFLRDENVKRKVGV